MGATATARPIRVARWRLLLAPRRCCSRSPPPPLAQSTLDTLRQRDQELEAVRAEQRQAAETEARLKREIDAHRRRPPQAQSGADRHRRPRCAPSKTRIAETEARLKPLDDSERGIRQSLDGRRAAIAEVLAALQRIGRHPPPAMMVRPEDALASVRTAIMLGAVLPDMRVQAEALAADLADLVRIRKEIAEETRAAAARPRGARRGAPAHRAADRGAAEEAGRDREGARGRAAEGRRAGPPGRQSQRFDRQARAGPRPRHPRRPRRPPAPRRGKGPRTAGSIWRP